MGEEIAALEQEAHRRKQRELKERQKTESIENSLNIAWTTTPKEGAPPQPRSLERSTPHGRMVLHRPSLASEEACLYTPQMKNPLYSAQNDSGAKDGLLSGRHRSLDPSRTFCIKSTKNSGNSSRGFHGNTPEALHSLRSDRVKQKVTKAYNLLAKDGPITHTDRPSKAPCDHARLVPYEEIIQKKVDKRGSTLTLQKGRGRDSLLRLRPAGEERQDPLSLSRPGGESRLQFHMPRGLGGKKASLEGEQSRRLIAAMAEEEVVGSRGKRMLQLQPQRMVIKLRDHSTPRPVINLTMQLGQGTPKQGYARHDSARKRIK